MFSTRVLKIALVYLSVLASACSLTLRDPNTCIKEETFNITKSITVSQPISVRSYKWCLRVPPRCTTYRTELRQIMENQIIPMTRKVISCCAGYQLESQGACVPICTNSCLYGTCIAPETCIEEQLPTLLHDTPNLLEYDNSPIPSPTTLNPVEGVQIEKSLHNVPVNSVTEETIYSEKSSNLSLVNLLTGPINVGPHSHISTVSPHITTSSDYSAQVSEVVEKDIITQAAHLQDETEAFPEITNKRIQYENLNNKLTSEIVTDKAIEDISLDKPKIYVEETLNTSEKNTEKSRNDTSYYIRRNVSGQMQEVPKLSSDFHNTIWRDTLEQTTAQEHKKSNNDTTYSKTPMIYVSDKFLYSITISVGIVFAIIIVTVIITKHQRHLEDISPRCGNTRNAEKLKAVHKAEEQETSLQVVTYKVTRETLTQPLTEETAINNPTRNSTILVYNFPPPTSAFDVPPVRPPLRAFGDYDVPSPITENVYDEIPAHRNVGEVLKCCNNNTSTGQEMSCSPFVIQFASLIANDAASTLQPNS